jgi:type VI secretion system protein ImpC
MVDSTTTESTAAPAVSSIEQIVSKFKQTSADQARALIKTFVEYSLKGDLKWNKNLTISMNDAVEKVDKKMSTQLAKIIHNPDFLSIEGTWRGLHYLVKNTETSPTLKIKVMNVTKREIFKDLDKAVEFDQSQLFKKIYEGEFGVPGGEPYSVLIGDYEFTNHPDDISLLKNISGVASSAFAPFIASSSSALLGLDSWEELSKPRDLSKIFDSVEYASWKDFRRMEDSRFVVLTLPRVLSRLPYGASTLSIDEFDFEECDLDASGKTKSLSHNEYSWMNCAYVLGARLTHAFSLYGWCTAIRGAEGGGLVDDLPLHVFKSDDGDLDSTCPTEIGITDRREAELSDLGFLSLCHYKNTAHAVFFGGQTVQKPLKYDLSDATANAEISARIPFILATSRFAHYLKVIARDKIGSFMEVEDVERWLNRWIMNYVNANPQAGQEMKAKYPLAEARVQVSEIPGRPGSYNAVAWLRPWLQLEELTTSMRLVAHIPKLG